MTRRIEREPDQKGRSDFLDWFWTLLMVVVKVKVLETKSARTVRWLPDNGDDDSLRIRHSQIRVLWLSQWKMH